MKKLPVLSVLSVFLGLNPGMLLAASKAQPKEAYLVRPSSETVKRRQSVLSLTQAGDAGSVSTLIEALADKDPMTRTLAVQGLGTLKVAAAAAPLADLLAKDPYPEVRQAAAFSLRQIEVPSTVAALGKALKDPEVNVRVVSLTGLAHYKDVKSSPLVQTACKDTSADVRRTAVFVLSRLEDPASIPTVQLLLKDPDDSVRAGAAQALGELRAYDSTALLRPLLKDPNKVIQASAARSLLMLKDNSGFEAAQILAKDANLGVRVVAIDALGWSKDPAAETELQSLLAQSPTDSRPALEAALSRTQQLRKQ